MSIFLLMDIAHTLSKLIENGLTQAEIAAAIGCSQPTVSEMARGLVGKSRPSWKIVEGIRKLAKEKGVELPEEVSP